MRHLKYISLFSGVECVSLAVQLGGLDWQPLCFAETAPFPSAVLAWNFPHVPNVGDVASFDWMKYRGQADIVIGGPPCQSFSIAGKRRSLSDRRGNLTWSFVEAVNAIDPEIVIWENVPGILSVKDNAFGKLLAGLVGKASPLILPGGKKWTNAGVAIGSRRIAAWRILDARHFGVPQRRRRIFLIAGRIGGWANPVEILFKPESLRRHPAPRRETEAGTPPSADLGITKASRRA